MQILPSVFEFVSLQDFDSFIGVPGHSLQCIHRLVPFAVCVPLSSQDVTSEARAMAKHRGNKMSESPPLLREQEGLI